MKQIKFISGSQKETIRFGAALAKQLRAADIICLFGDLGSGKTTLVKGIAGGLGIKQTEVHSPTFVILNIYEGRESLYHFDFYRMDTVEEIMSIGYDEFLYGEGVSVIEWAERFGDLMPKDNLSIRMSFKSETERLIKISAYGPRYQKILSKIKL